MNKEKYIVPKQLFLASFIMAIVVYSISLILNIISLVVAADSFTFSRYWYLYLTIVLGIFLALGFILYSAWILAFTKDKSKGGQILIKFLSEYVLLSATYSFIAAVFTAINDYTSTVIVTLVLSILQLAVGIICALLSKKSPKIARIVLIVEFSLFVLSEFLNIIFYIIASNFLSMVTSMLVLAFEIVVLIALILMKVEVENDEEESTPLANKEAKESLPKQEINQEEKLNLLLKYKSLLDNGVLTQEEFDAKKKELLQSKLIQAFHS